MGVYIKGMEMPKRCPCGLVGVGYDLYCSFTSGIPLRMREYRECCEKETRPDWCPIGDVPAPHGRLIDADKLHKATYHRAFETEDDTMWQSGCWVRYRAIEQVQDSQPTIIEAEE